MNVISIHTSHHGSVSVASEDISDLKEMMLKSDLKYAWLPDIQKLIIKNES
jgi:hypothetical protein